MSYYLYWAKTDKRWARQLSYHKAGPPPSFAGNYHLLPYHNLDVAAAGWALLQLHEPWREALLASLELDLPQLERWIVLPLAWHDIGKFSPTFQHLVPSLSTYLTGRLRAQAYDHRHDLLGAILWDKMLSGHNDEQGWLRLPALKPRKANKLIEVWLEGIWGHHGRPIDSSQRGQAYFPDCFDQAACDAALSFVQDTAQLLWDPSVEAPSWTMEMMPALKRASWLLAGFYVLCDWIGSDSSYFPFCDAEVPLEEYWERAKQQALCAVREKGVIPSTPASYKGFSGIFPSLATYSPTPLQLWAAELSLPEGCGPQLFIAEDETGSGKTEASLLLAHKLMSGGGADGLYIGLPTMATANAMFQRAAQTYRRLYDEHDAPSLALAHGLAREDLGFKRVLLNSSAALQGQAGHQYAQNCSAGEEDWAGEATCAAWLGDDRRLALLAQVGVGTVDQALLGVLASKHQALRLYGLHRKVLILDEIHAYDSYTFTLVCALVRFHAAQGGHVVILSATLPQHMRQRLTDSFLEGVGGQAQPLPTHAADAPYPLLTWVNSRAERAISEHPIAPARSAQKHYDLAFIHTAQDALAMTRRWAQAEDRCACWIRNTVKEAVEVAQALVQELGDERVILFHARFTPVDRQRIEKQILTLFGKRSTPEARRGKIVVATQVVEQSLDLDFDEMLIDLAPIDLVLQRLGRFRRHARDAQGAPRVGQDQRAPAKPHILCPEWTDAPDKRWSKDTFAHATLIYPRVDQLWLTQKVLMQSAEQRLTIPLDTRALMAAVYDDDALVPEGLIAQMDEATSKASAEGYAATLAVLELEEGYTKAGDNWLPEQRSVTRLGQASSTLRFLVDRGRGLEPLHGLHTSWTLNQVNALAYYAAAEDPAQATPALNAAKEKMPDRGRFALCVVLTAHSSVPGVWMGRVMNERCVSIPVEYSHTWGLSFPNEDDRGD